ncbi:N-6 DNA methylase [Candidatus Chloroploca sp. M-50]|uniref:site-specific DNA-methyltransferase (adenine-specific) n=1 Tax=Candidatus Chloroploca mongolica TaxID=2528176 RepID=A0ABS4DEE0_9CHLR|nr:N-6 DNA methylase [Candidatus Chloroploca mongolica]
MEARFSATQLLDLTHNGLQELGYRDDLLRHRYSFADVLIDSSPTRTIDLAAFAQEPPSYRSACFGVAILDQYGPDTLQQYRALGAPQILVLSPEQGIVRRWRMTASGAPTFIEEIAPEHLSTAFHANRNEWNPDAVLRAKSIGFARGPVQLDFFDTGLLPTLEGTTHKKLDQLLRDVLATCKAVYAEHHDSEPDYQALFRLIFRFIASKMLADRGYPGDDWLHPDPQRVIAAVDAFYFRQAPDEGLLQDPLVQRVAWDTIRTAFLFQNLSVEALAYVYENTLVSERNRELFDTHATPPQLAEYIVQQLPFDELPQDERRVFEPFTGHAPFLIAALGRLRTLLPSTMDTNQRHDYFVRMLRGMELDAFAREVARYSLILADYPNPDGWDIRQADVFSSPHTDTYLQQARIVLCNPPFSDVPTRGTQTRLRAGAAKRAVEALNRVMRYPPAQLGFVLPKAFVSGQEYRNARKQLAASYQEIAVVTLPDTVFQYSDVETVLLTAHSPRTRSPRRRTASVNKQDYDRFLQTGIPTWQEELPSESINAADYPVFWRTPLWRVWEALSRLPRLGDVAEVHRGIEYRVPMSSHKAELVSSEPRSGFAAGLVSAKDNFEPFFTGKFAFLNTDASVMLYEAYKLPWDRPKVIVNAARLSRGPWRIAAVIDHQGLVCYQRFHGIWAKANTSLEEIASVLNSPLANAFLYTNPAAGGRDNQIRAIEDIPFPDFTTAQTQTLVILVNQYRLYRSQWLQNPDQAEELEETCRQLLAQIDAEVLSAYELPPRLEKQLLDTFAGYQRPGPVHFTGYYPTDFRPAIPWRIFISQGFQNAGARSTISRLPVLNDPVISVAVRELDDSSDDDYDIDA